MTAKKKLGTAKKTPTESPSSLVVPKHGHGRIYQGPAMNPVAGPGRPPNAIRESMRGTLEEILPGIRAKYNQGIVQPLDFANFLAKYGLGTKDEMTLTSEQVKGLCHAYSATVMQIIAEEAPDAFLRIQARVETELAQVGV